jgi:hypothetical protein
MTACLDPTDAKNAHYIGGLNLGIAVAHVVSVILAVEGYVCAQQQWRAPRRRRSTLGNRANGVRMDAAARQRVRHIAFERLCTR